MWLNSRTAVALIPFLVGLVCSRPCSASNDGFGPPPDTEAGIADSIFVEQQTDCMAIPDIKSALRSVLDPREESEFMIVTVVVSPAVDGTLAVLRAIDRETGEILLERTLNIADGECGDAHLVLKVMMEQFLTGFPIEKWKEKQVRARTTSAGDETLAKTEKVVVEKEIFPVEWLLLFGIDSRWPTPSGDLEIALGVDSGPIRHGVITQLVLRAGWPHTLGEGRYLESTALLALGWRFAPTEKLVLRTELRAGAVLVSGFGYEKNYREWIVMLEAQLSILWRLGSVYLGPEAAISPLFHTVHNESGEKKDLPWIRFGILLGFSLGKNVLK
jgi:hypothetical protein